VTTLRCAVYARTSTDKQSHLSPDDQIRKCREFADGNSFHVLDDYIFIDEGLSGSGSDRPAFQRLLNAAYSRPGPFEIILVDDTSRFSRRQSEAMSTVENLRFQGLRVIFVSQGIDTHSEQSDVEMTVHGLVDSLYVKELAKKTYRGLEGNFLRGCNTGGRTYGYATLDTVDGKRMVINEAEADVVRQIFEMSASGYSLKRIAKTLNAQHIQSPRPRKGRGAMGWCPTAVREMLYNERYAGRLIWNKAKFVKVPGTNRRVARPRQEKEWKIREAPQMRIVSAELWQKVQHRLLRMRAVYAQGRPKGLLSRSASSSYLFSGILVCAECGGKLRIITGHGKNNHPRWGCPLNFNRGTCPNTLRERNDRVEPYLLAGLQESVLQPEAIDYVLVEFQVELDRQLKAMSGQVDDVRVRKSAVETELARLAEAVAQGGALPALMTAISSRETEIKELDRKLLGAGPRSLKATIDEIRVFILSRLKDIRRVLHANIEQARMELFNHVDRIVMRPVGEGNDRFYSAEGDWNLLGHDKGRPEWAAPGNLEMVAGVGFEPTTFGL
jgi:site-specific DNA recombinase